RPADAGGAHQVVGRFDTEGMVFEVHPDVVEADQAGHFIDRRICEVQRDANRGFFSSEFLFDEAGTHAAHLGRRDSLSVSRSINGNPLPADDVQAVFDAPENGKNGTVRPLNYTRISEFQSAQLVSRTTDTGHS